MHQTSWLASTSALAIGLYHDRIAPANGTEQFNERPETRSVTCFIDDERSQAPPTYAARITDHTQGP